MFRNNNALVKNKKLLYLQTSFAYSIGYKRVLFSTNYKLYNENNSNKNINTNKGLLNNIKKEIEKSKTYCTNQYSKLFQTISKQREKINELSKMIQNASTSINKVTGYDSIQSLKSGIKSLEIKLYQDRITLDKETHKLKKLTKSQNHSQSVINDLLSRKSTWSPNDLKVFTDSYNENQQNIQDLNEQHIKTSKLENLVKTMEQDLHNLILKRYHEEQIWSDKIRKLSTYGTLLLLVINLLSFFILHLLFEPRKRRRLVEAFEKETKEYIEEVKNQQVEQMVRLENLINSKMEMLFNDRNNEILEKEKEKKKTFKYVAKSWLRSIESLVNNFFNSLKKTVSKLFIFSSKNKYIKDIETL